MKRVACLSSYLSGPPAASCLHYDAGDVVVCRAKGKARNAFPLLCGASAIALETDGDSYRFPPDATKDVCDWCVFTKTGLRGWFIELKGSRYGHAIDQLMSTMSYMQTSYGVEPKCAIAVLSGTHPSNARPGKANAKVKFARRFPATILCERSSGKPRPEDIVR